MDSWGKCNGSGGRLASALAMDAALKEKGLDAEMENVGGA
ncbi:hypothetical protein PR001_g5095 [Phytophthora rubi]|uniref:Uncharacterized protein n=1 Tax=Phytophthora rubi TaxID=129364 RepID=A0A6A3NPC9_9STRA|nr:hypothetical protein PR001_g5095 [Phytophthora rubi]